jgi:ferric-dicitrate binding protein FerR (iron transport regulator)
VKVAPGSTAAVILNKPGQQTKVDNAGKARLVEAVDVDEVMAWKEGRFQFNGCSVEQIMDQLSRWYNLDIVYKDKINETFVADIRRDLPVSKLLALLEMTKQIKFVIEGNKITVAK